MKTHDHKKKVKKEKGREGGNRRRSFDNIRNDETHDFDMGGNQESAKRYAKRSRQWPFKLPEALATNDRDKDWDALDPGPGP